jgi:aspartyl-tRNA synthetase
LESFGALLTALAAGAPPHGGFALGFDRLAALLADHVAALTIIDVIAFPKSAAGNEPMTGAPAAVSRAALAEYHIEPLA